ISYASPPALRPSGRRTPNTADGETSGLLRRVSVRVQGLVAGLVAVGGEVGGPCEGRAGDRGAVDAEVDRHLVRCRSELEDTGGHIIRACESDRGRPAPAVRVPTKLEVGGPVIGRRHRGNG